MCIEKNVFFFKDLLAYISSSKIYEWRLTNTIGLTESRKKKKHRKHSTNRFFFSSPSSTNCKRSKTTIISKDSPSKVESKKKHEERGKKWFFSLSHALARCSCPIVEKKINLSWSNIDLTQDFWKLNIFFSHFKSAFPDNDESKVDHRSSKIFSRQSILTVILNETITTVYWRFILPVQRHLPCPIDYHWKFLQIISLFFS